MSRRTVTETTAGVRVALTPAAEAWTLLAADPPLQRIAVTEVTLREGELLVEVELATVCGADRRAVAGHRTVFAPRVLGHEQVGRIAALGPGIPPTTYDGLPLAVGDRIVWSATVACGACALCLEGVPQRCEHAQRYGRERVRRGWELSGGLATHVHLLARTVIARARDWIPAAVLAPASCATASAAAAVDAAERIRPLAGETVLVSGCGMRGLTTVAMAHERGARVIAVDPDPRRRDLALALGATSIHAPGRAPAGYRIAVELTGAIAAITAAVAGAGTGGVVVVAGEADASPLAVPADSIARGLLTLRGAGDYRAEHLMDAVRFLERTDHDLFASLVGETVAFEDAPRALTSAATAGVRTAIRP